MSLLERIKADQLAARKNRNAVVANVLGTVIAECDTRAKQGKVARVLSDGDVVAIIQSTGKRIAETIGLLKDKNDRADDLAKYEEEALCLKAYLPQQLTREEVTEIAVRQHTFGLSVGQIMTHLREQYAGRYDAKQAAEIAREITSTD